MKNSHPSQIRLFVAYTNVRKKPFFFPAQFNSLSYFLLKTLLSPTAKCSDISLEELEYQETYLQFEGLEESVQLYHKIHLGVFFHSNLKPVKIYRNKDASFYTEIYTREQHEIIQNESQ